MSNEAVNKMNLKKCSKKTFKITSILFGVIIFFVALPLVYPAPLFAYHVAYDNLDIFSDMQIPTEKANNILKQVQLKLSTSPIQIDNIPMQIYIANTTWRRHWLWIVRPNNPGGFIVAPFTRNHAFLSGADFETNELISPSGYRTQPPRTIAYFAIHELTHTMTYKKVGLLRFFLMPKWIKEGIADYVAMPEENAFSLFAKIGERDADLSMMKSYGVYAPYRLLIAYLLEEEEWSIEQLLNSKLTLQEARSHIFNKLKSYQKFQR